MCYKEFYIVNLDLTGRKGDGTCVISVPESLVLIQCFFFFFFFRGGVGGKDVKILHKGINRSMER